MAETLKDRVIRAAVDRIAASGPDGLSFRQIAADAGVSHQAPYHHFADRHAILGAIALVGFRKFVDDLTAPVRDDDDSDPAVRLAERYVDFALAHKGYFRVMFRSDLCRMGESPELLDAADAAFGVLIEAVTGIVGPSASVDDVRTTATTMWSVAHGLATLLIDGPLEHKIGAVADRRALVRAVARQTRDGFRS